MKALGALNHLPTAPSASDPWRNYRSVTKSLNTYRT